MTLHWVIQDSPYREEGHYKLKGVLEKLDIPHTEVKIVPFSHEIVPEPEVENPIIVMGSVNLAKQAIQRGWKPGAFFDDNPRRHYSNFDYRSYLEFYGSEMLNYDGIITTLGEVDSPWNRFFIRPTADLKEFAGMVMSFIEVERWADSIREIEQSNYTTLNTSTPVVIAPLKDIFKEYRFFVVKGKVVTGSLYKEGDRVIYKEQLDGADEYAQKIVDMWQPADAFVLDVAMTEEGFNVLEVNCFNSAGYYAIDIYKLVEAVMEAFSD